MNEVDGGRLSQSSTESLESKLANPATSSELNRRERP
jgi:hypothetical protein